MLFRLVANFVGTVPGSGRRENHVLVVREVASELAVEQFGVAFFVAVQAENRTTSQVGRIFVEYAIREGKVASTIFRCVADSTTVGAHVPFKSTVRERRVAFALEPTVVVNRTAIQSSLVALEGTVHEYWAAFAPASVVVNGCTVTAKVFAELAVGDGWLAAAVLTINEHPTAAAGDLCFVGLAVCIASRDDKTVNQGACAHVFHGNNGVGIVNLTCLAYLTT